MTLILELPDSKEAALKAKAQAQGVSAEEYVQRIVDRDLQESGAPAETAQRHISDVILDIWSDLTPEELAMLPRDGAGQVDHYVYGLPKRDQ